jgi:hypothetical protein
MSNQDPLPTIGNTPGKPEPPPVAPKFPFSLVSPPARDESNSPGRPRPDRETGRGHPSPVTRPVSSSLPLEGPTQPDPGQTEFLWKLRAGPGRRQVREFLIDGWRGHPTPPPGPWQVPTYKPPK